MLKETFHLASRKEGTATARLIDAIIRERPDLADTTFYVAGRGHNGCTVLTVDEVFKSPRAESEDEPYRDACTEYQLQKFLHEKGLAVSEVTCLAEHGEFFGMQRLHGERLNYLKISRAEVLADIHYQIGKFIAEVETASLSADFDPIRANMIQPSVNPVAINAEKQFKSEAVQKAMNNPALLDLLNEQVKKLMAARPVLIHDDLHGSNVLLQGSGDCGFLDMGCAKLAHSVYTEIGMHWGQDYEAKLKGYVQNQTRRTEADIVCEDFLQQMVFIPEDKLLAWCTKTAPTTARRLEELGALKEAPASKSGIARVSGSKMKR